MRFAPSASIGIMHDWYPQNTSAYNSVQQLNLEKSRLKIPFMQFGECLHGVGSMKQSIFPQSIGLAASFDTDLVYHVGRAIGSEARAIGIHACLSPVLDLGLEPRWGRVQGKSYIKTNHIYNHVENCMLNFKQRHGEKTPSSLAKWASPCPPASPKTALGQIQTP